MFVSADIVPAQTDSSFAKVSSKSCFWVSNRCHVWFHRLGTDQQLRMRVQFLNNVAFIYDPIFGESGTDDKSLLLDWGDKESNEMIINHVTEDGSIFHTFVFPINKVDKESVRLE